MKELVEQARSQAFRPGAPLGGVNLRAISHVTRGENETRTIHLKGREEVLPVSRSYLHLFSQM